MRRTRNSAIPTPTIPVFRLSVSWTLGPTTSGLRLRDAIERVDALQPHWPLRPKNHQSAASVARETIKGVAIPSSEKANSPASPLISTYHASKIPLNIRCH